MKDRQPSLEYHLGTCSSSPVPTGQCDESKILANMRRGCALEKSGDTRRPHYYIGTAAELLGERHFLYCLNTNKSTLQKKGRCLHLYSLGMSPGETDISIFTVLEFQLTCSSRDHSFSFQSDLLIQSFLKRQSGAS